MDSSIPVILACWKELTLRWILAMLKGLLLSLFSYINVVKAVANNVVLVLSYAKNIGIRRAISSGNPETYKKLDIHLNTKPFEIRTSKS